MRITFPHLGNAYIAVESFLEVWGMNRSHLLTNRQTLNGEFP